MRWHKDITRGPRARACIAWLLAQYIRLVRATTRWQVRGGDGPHAYVRAGRPVIVVLWHQRLMMLPWAWQAVARGHPFHVLISTHRDGELLARVFSHLGTDTIRGSSSRGGASAFQQILACLARGEAVGVTPDGPRGPRMRLGGGVVHAARRSGAVIVPVTFATSSRLVLRSWDRFVVAHPFSRGIVAWGEPMEVAADTDDQGLEVKRRELETALTELTHGCDREVGATPIEPAPRTDS
ncbi:lysophospholipid acyltransferase family protein [Aquisalimonas lutea]|uniref:lysophospholipid acyltransferase family protein n=1 Tax=Aquisalimonas lutea TaxID=1327750 RepID=UPI0025B3BA03|nr:lysophospholipid acyltransferase family protein [Aquisalimonas lutea]MDN3515987.1 lysophospholipid acyltransferase family protein [Aquisalimonas lutea]